MGVVTPAHAAVSPLDFTVNTSETVVVDTTNGTPSINLDVGDVTRQAVYHSGSNSSALVFRYTPVAGDVDLDGVALGSAINPNSGLLRDTNGNPMTDFTVSPPSTPNVKINYPSLSMDFVADSDGRYTLNGTAYDTLATFLSAASGTFSRSSIGTYFDSSGVLQTASSGTPRFDHDPVTHAAKGILIEESRTNLLTRSAEIDNAAWTTKSNLTITANAATAPDGTNTADKAIPNNGTGMVVRLRQDPSLTNGTTYTASVYLKAAEMTTAAVFMDTTAVSPTYANSGTYINLTNGTVSGSISIPITVTSVGNGWYRVHYSVAVTSSGTVGILCIVPGSTGSVNNITGNGTSGIYVWGAQVEAGAFPTSYIPTTSAAVTRTTDNLNLPTSGWFNANTGSLFAQFIAMEPSSTYHQILSISGNDGTTDRVSMAYSQQKVRSEIGASNTLSVNSFYTPSVLAANTTHKGGITYANRTNIVSISANGSLTSGNGTGTGTFVAPSVTTFRVGDRPSASAPLSGWIKSARYYPLTISDTQLQLLTQ